MLAQLGNFQFELSTIVGQEIERITQYRFAETDRIGQHNLLQAVGKDNEIVRINGMFYPEAQDRYGGSGNPFDELRRLSDSQEPQLLVTLDGESHGYWVVFDLNTRASLFLPQGRGAQRVEFNLQLKYYGDA